MQAYNSFVMLNLYAAIKNSDAFRKLEVNALLFAEFTCMREETKFGIWSNNNYFAFISSGKKMWKTTYNSYEVNNGDIIFVKKGANLTHQFFDDEFCAIFIFIPDDFITAFLQRNTTLLQDRSNDISAQDAVLRINSDPLLESYYHSIRSYLAMATTPNEQLLTLKFEELLLSLFSNKQHRHLTDYFISLGQNQQSQLMNIMENNFAFNLSLENYAQLCHMSLSTFKKFFKQCYHSTPAVWLKDKKLELSAQQLLTTDLSIGQVSFNCGFEDTSHFIRVFKQKNGSTPLQYRQQRSVNVIAGA